MALLEFWNTNPGVIFMFGVDFYVSTLKLLFLLLLYL